MLKLLLLLLLLIFVAATPTGGVHIKLTGLECQAVDAEFCAFENCVIKPLSRGIKEINGRIRLLQLPVTNVTVRMELKRRGSKHPLYSFEIDGCQFWLNKRRNPIADIIFKSIQLDSFSNINHSCPYNHDLIIDHFRLDESLSINLPIARGDFAFKSYWLAFNVLRGTVHGTFEIE